MGYSARCLFLSLQITASLPVPLPLPLLPPAAGGVNSRKVQILSRFQIPILDDITIITPRLARP